MPLDAPLQAATPFFRCLLFIFAAILMPCLHVHIDFHAAAFHADIYRR